MGMTGVGKSSFIDLFTKEKVPIGTDLESCEQFLARASI
jgi:predicted GTPase